jgi:hypothetical protein
VREDLDAAENPSDGQGREGLFSRCAMSTERKRPFSRKRRSLGLTAVVRLRPAYEPGRPGHFHARAELACLPPSRSCRRRRARLCPYPRLASLISDAFLFLSNCDLFLGMIT